MPHNISSQGVDMEFQWVIWWLTSRNAICVITTFLRHVQDKAALIRGMIYALFANMDLLVACSSPLGLSRNCQTSSKTSFAMLGPSPLISGAAIHQNLYPQPAGFDCGRNVVDIADGLDISENQQHVCHFHLHTLDYCFSFKGLGSFLANLYILMIFLKYQIKSSITHKYPCRI